MFMRIIYSVVLFLLLQIPIHAENESPAHESVVLAGGCFWCIEADFEKLKGVVDVVSGYAGGHLLNPTYQQVSMGGSGHIEVVKVIYDAKQLSYDQVLDYYWRHIDPTRDDGQFCDRGKQYRPAIFYRDEKQRQQAQASQKHIEKIKTFDEPLKVELIKLDKFYLAEDYHQDYYRKNPIRYKFYRYSCGRDARVKSLWGGKT